MMLGLLGGVLFYRPIFSTFLKDTDIREWMKKDLIAVKTDIKFKSFKTDSLKETTTDFKTYFGDRFTKISTDTALRDILSYQTIDKTDTKPVFVNKKVNLEKYIKFIFLVWLMILFVTMAYGPVAAFLVELFPTKIRYTSMSLPYHIGNGVFGGLVPFIGLLLTTTYPTDPLVGLWYPIGVAALCFVIGSLYLRNKIDKNIND
jgi:hypothetical protein